MNVGVGRGWCRNGKSNSLSPKFDGVTRVKGLFFFYSFFLFSLFSFSLLMFLGLAAARSQDLYG